MIAKQYTIFNISTKMCLLTSKYIKAFVSVYFWNDNTNKVPYTKEYKEKHQFVISRNILIRAILKNYLIL